ncbi:MAG: Lrp/AsnC family transcriptional regulator [Candidatus Bathyarchaeia archaeon]
MSDPVELDAVDIKILNILIHDARTRLKDIAQECGTSSVFVLNRIKVLRNLKVINGSTTALKSEAIGLPIMATIGMIVDGNKEQEILKALEEQAYIVEPSPSIGEYDLCAFVFARSISELDKIACSIKETFAVRKITLNVWSGVPQLNFENVNLQPIRRKK